MLKFVGVFAKVALLGLTVGTLFQGMDVIITRVQFNRDNFLWKCALILWIVAFLSVFFALLLTWA